MPEGFDKRGRVRHIIGDFFCFSQCGVIIQRQRMFVARLNPSQRFDRQVVRRQRVAKIGRAALLVRISKKTQGGGFGHDGDSVSSIMAEFHAS